MEYTAEIATNRARYVGRVSQCCSARKSRAPEGQSETPPGVPRTGAGAYACLGNGGNQVTSAAPACASSARYTPSAHRPRPSSRHTVDGCRPSPAAMSSQRTPSDLNASIRTRSVALSRADILDTSTGGCCIPRPAIMTDHSQPPVESALPHSCVDAPANIVPTTPAVVVVRKAHVVCIEHVVITAWNVLPLPTVDLDNSPSHPAVKCRGVLDVEAADLVGIQLPPAPHRMDAMRALRAPSLRGLSGLEIARKGAEQGEKEPWRLGRRGGAGPMKEH